jgi:hypothetical protein
MIKVEIQYVCVNLDSKDVLLTTNKKALSKFMKVTTMTLYRILPIYGKLEYKSFIIWLNVPVSKCNYKGNSFKM